MRRKHTFLLTIFPSEEQQPALHGRLEFIANGASHTFNSLSELQNLIETSIHTEPSSERPLQIRTSTPSYQTRSGIYPAHCEEED